MVSQFKAAGLLLNMVTGIDYKAAVVLFGVIVFVYVAFADTLPWFTPMLFRAA